MILSANDSPWSISQPFSAVLRRRWSQLAREIDLRFSPDTFFIGKPQGYLSLVERPMSDPLKAPTPLDARADSLLYFLKTQDLPR